MCPVRVIPPNQKKDQNNSVPFDEITFGPISPGENKIPSAPDNQTLFQTWVVPNDSSPFMPAYKSPNDPVNNPSHYLAGGIETKDFIRAKLSKDGWEGYCRGNVLKYVSRIGLKGFVAVTG